MTAPACLSEIVPVASSDERRKGKVRFSLHPGQSKAWASVKRFILVLAGTQSGKTSFGPLWMHREIQARGPGDYIVVTPTYPLLMKKALPEFLRLFDTRLKLGTYQSQLKIFTFSPEGSARTFGTVDHDTPTQIFFGHAQDPDALESATAKAAWLDECGQDQFRLGSWEAVQRRLALHQGRVLGTTTPYNLGWIKSQIYDRARAGDPNYLVV